MDGEAKHDAIYKFPSNGCRRTLSNFSMVHGKDMCIILQSKIITPNLPFTTFFDKERAEQGNPLKVYVQASSTLYYHINQETEDLMDVVFNKTSVFSLSIFKYFS